MLELKSIKHAAFASQETHCYTGKLYWKGKHVADMENDGHGGPDNIHFKNKDAEIEVLAYADKNLRVSDDPEFADLYERATPWSLLEMWSGHRVNDWLTEKELKQIMAKRVIYTVKGEEGLLYQTKPARNAAQRDQWIPQVMAWDTTDKVLNSLPLAQALAIFEGRTS